MFQSSPTWSGGCNPLEDQNNRSLSDRFNPHPPGRVGATCLAGFFEVVEVSIHLTHLVGWVQPPLLRVIGHPENSFNPHPPGRVGATCTESMHVLGDNRRFNPHPPGRVGATRTP